MVSHVSSDLPEDSTRRARDETEAEKLRSAGLDEPESVSGNTNLDPGTETDAERIRSDRIDPE